MAVAQVRVPLRRRRRGRSRPRRTAAVARRTRAAGRARARSICARGELGVAHGDERARRDHDREQRDDGEVAQLALQHEPRRHVASPRIAQVALDLALDGEQLRRRARRGRRAPRRARSGTASTPCASPAPSASARCARAARGTRAAPDRARPPDRRTRRVRRRPGARLARAHDRGRVARQRIHHGERGGLVVRVRAHQDALGAEERRGGLAGLRHDRQRRRPATARSGAMSAMNHGPDIAVAALPSLNRRRDHRALRVGGRDAVGDELARERHRRGRLGRRDREVAVVVDHLAAEAVQPRRVAVEIDVRVRDREARCVASSSARARSARRSSSAASSTRSVRT